jgi:hypothetical protein
MKTAEYLDLVRETLHLPSDYALQKPLGVSKSQLSAYRTGKESLSDVMAQRVSEICQIPLGKVLLDVHMEKSKSPELRAAWQGIMEKISESFKDLLLGRSPRVA